MTRPIKAAITVGEPNWTPLELVLPACELENFMYMGRAGEIELYKHWLTRRATFDRRLLRRCSFVGGTVCSHSIFGRKKTVRFGES